MSIPARQLPGYKRHSCRTKGLVVQHKLRAYWDMLRLVRHVLETIEKQGGAAHIQLFPGEHYLLAQTALDFCTRARRLIASNSPNPELEKAENDLRNEYLKEALEGDSPSEIPDWHQRALGAIRELEAFREFRMRAIDEGPFDKAAVAQGGYSQRLANRFFGGYYPWFAALAKWAEAQKLTVLFPSPGVDFSLRPKGAPAAIPGQILVVIVASEQSRRRAWFERQNRGLPTGPWPKESVGLAVLHFVNVVKREDDSGKVSIEGRPTIFVAGGNIDLVAMKDRLAELSRTYRAGTLYGFAPVSGRVLRDFPDPPDYLKLVPVSYKLGQVASVVATAAELLGLHEDIGDG